MTSSRQAKTALISGVSRGIGAALVEPLASEGYRVMGCARAERHEATGLAHYTQCDVSNPADVSRWADRVSGECDGLDLLIHNASVLGPRAPLTEVSVEEWERTIAINLTGSFLVARAFFGLLEAAHASTVVMMSSSVGRKGRGEWGPYSASKFGVEALVDILADELGEGSTVVSVNPGGTATDMRAEAYPDEDPGTLPSADDIAERIVRLITTLDASNSRDRFDIRDMLD